LAEASKRFGLTSSFLWAEAEVVQGLSLRGRHREALEIADTMLRDTFAGRSHYQVATLQTHRAVILAARGRSVDALVDGHAALEETRKRGEPQAFLPAAVCYAFVLWAAGRPREALAELEPLMGDKNIAGMADFTSPAPLLLVELGRGDLYAGVLATIERPSNWHRAAAHVVAGDFDRAADVYAEIGAQFLEAWSRLLAAERGAPGQADRAHAYFAAEEASWFVGRCAALLPASA